MRVELVDLTASGGPLASGNSQATAINNQGQIVGWAETHDKRVRAFCCAEDGPWQDLGDLPGFAAQRIRPAAINHAGWIVGSATDDSSNQRPWLWTPEKGMRDLGGGKHGIATAINDAGQVVGSADSPPADAQHAFLWDVSSGMRDLGTLGGQYSGALCINGVGCVGGFSAVAGGPPLHAFLWTAEGGLADIRQPLAPSCYVVAMSAGGHIVVRGSVLQWGHSIMRFRPESLPEIVWDTDWGPLDRLPEAVLYCLGGKPAGENRVKAEAVNSAGYVVGQARTAAGDFHACVWPAAKQPIDLGVLAGCDSSYAVGVNDRGDVVGQCSGGSGKTRAVLWHTG